MEDQPRTPEQVCRKWLTDIRLAEKRDEKWKQLAKGVLDRYRTKNRRKNSFNILYSNTETLGAAVFNSLPKPDVRRRYKDADPVGKVASQLIQRALEFVIDTDNYAHTLSMDVLDMLLPGRGLSRVRYIPSIVQVGEMPSGEELETEHELQQGPEEELAWEQAATDHVAWDDFLILGNAKRWEQVEDIAFKHRLTRRELVAQFGEIGNEITLDDVDDDQIKKDEALADDFKTALVYEIWCKYDKKVYFIAQSYKTKPLKVVDDPLSLSEFFPIPRPMYAIADADTLEVTPLYEQYKEQAAELDRISTRINKIVDACKVRGIYDSTMAELGDLLRGDDNDLIPSQNAAKWIDAGGIERGVWMMPIEGPARVLQILYQQRDAAKQVIYEIIGLADIMRGASDPSETLGAQNLKAQFGGQRVNRMQSEVQRYVRDQLRLLSEIIAQKFQPETLLKMTGMQIPTEAEVMQQAQEYMAAVEQAQQAGQEPPPPPPIPVTLEQVMGVLRDDALRMFKIGVETDSMTAAAQQQDAQEMQQLLGGIAQFATAMGPIVQSGAMPIDAVKEIIMTICRRARMGSAVEDALDKMQAPPPPPDPNAGKAEAEQAKMQLAQAQMQLEKQKAEMQQANEQARMHADVQVEQARVQANAMVEQMKHQSKLEMESQRMQMEIAMKQQIAELEARVKFAIADRQYEAQAEIARNRPQVASD